MSQEQVRVLILVDGGVADYFCAPFVDVEIIDFDNLRAEGLSGEDIDERFASLRKWQETGVKP